MVLRSVQGLVPLTFQIVKQTLSQPTQEASQEAHSWDELDIRVTLLVYVHDRYITDKAGWQRWSLCTEPGSLEFVIS